MELWEQIEISPQYQVSNFGNVKGINGGALSKNNNGNGYLQISIRINRKRKNLYVHRMVAILFINNPDNKPRVNHKDGNKSNNHYLNLEWSTAKENTNHAIETGLITGMKSRGDYKPIIDMRTGVFYDSVMDASKATGIVWQTLYTWLNKPHRNKSSLIYAV